MIPEVFARESRSTGRAGATLHKVQGETRVGDERNAESSADHQLGKTRVLFDRIRASSE